MTDRQILILIVWLVVLVGIGVYFTDGVSRNEVEAAGAFVAGASFVYALFRGDD